LITGRCNPKQVFPIYTCNRHGNSKKPTAIKTPTHLDFHCFCCCAAEATSSRSSMCICDQESRSLESSSSAILHRERVNKVFGKRSSRLLARFVKFFNTAHLPLRRSHAEGRRLQRKLHQANRRLHPFVIVKEPQVTYGFCS
jgi:hypothetical protein